MKWDLLNNIKYIVVRKKSSIETPRMFQNMCYIKEGMWAVYIKNSNPTKLNYSQACKIKKEAEIIYSDEKVVIKKV